MKYLKEVFCLLFINNKICILTIKKIINIKFFLLFILNVNYFGFLNKKKITHSPQYESGCIFLKKNKFTLKLLDEWANVYRNDFSLADDSKSKLNNLKGFLENRHDQSIFSLICKKYGVKTLSAFEIDWAYLGKKRTWEHNKNCPILLKRDLKYNLLKRFLNRQKKTYKRIIKKVSSI